MSWKPLLILVALWALWDVGVALVGIRQVFPWQLRARLGHGEQPVLLDVRTKAEYRWFHIPGARHVSLPLPAPHTLDLGKDDEIILVCMTGHRSPVAAWKLKQQGYTNVANLTWGASAWALSGGELKTGDTP